MKAFTALALALGLAHVGATIYTVGVGEDFEAVCLHKVQPGDECFLEKGDHYHDGLTVTHGTAEKRITITGDRAACIKGSGDQDRVLQIAHDYYTIKDICFDGYHEENNEEDRDEQYVSTAIYVLGADKKSEKNGVLSSVTGLQLLDLEIKNSGSECVHFRYFVTHAEVSGCTFQRCGVDAFENGAGGKVGEGIYVGTALDQVNDGKAPEPKIRSGGSDDIDVDECSHNWIHFNTFRTYGNECVDVKEGSRDNVIENNICENQQDENSGGFGLRGSDNIVRYNEIADCVGAAVRIGGDLDYGKGNQVYGNKITAMGYGAFNLMSTDHGQICDNAVSDATLAVGSFKGDLDATEATTACATPPTDPDDFEFFDLKDSTDSTSADTAETTPTGSEDEGTGNTENTDSSSTDTSTDSSGTDSTDSSSTDSTDSSDDQYDVATNEAFGSSEAGVNGAAEPSPERIVEVETTPVAVAGEDGECSSIASLSHVDVEHSYYIDGSTEEANLFDGKLDTYFSVHRESTTITFELAAESAIDGVSIGFFFKGGEERIQKFDVSVKAADADNWTTVISGEESDGTTNFQHFEFTSPHDAMYVQFRSRGNTFNNWTALTQFHVCHPSNAEPNALFGGARAITKELQQLTGDVCPEPFLLTPRLAKITANGEDNNVAALFDGDFSTRWSTEETTDENDLQNGRITLHFIGDQNVAWVKIAFFDGHLAHQHFSLYKESAAASEWTPVLQYANAQTTESFQTYDIDETGVNKLYIVANGNDVGHFTKVSEVEAWGC